MLCGIVVKIHSGFAKTYSAFCEQRIDMAQKFFHTIICIAISLAVLFTEAATTNTTVNAASDIHSYPVIPSMTGWVGARTAYLARRGLRLGNRAHVFSKIGDSITSWTFFLTPFATGAYDLGSYSNLKPVIAAFSQDGTRIGTSFANYSLAADGGWTAADLLDPAKANPGACGKAETPLDCELRVNKPEIALVMIGTNDLLDGNVAKFSATLHRVLTTIENHYVIPVVSTIPYRRDIPTLESRVPSYNQAIINLALAHGAPLWNYWLAVEGLPSNGVSIDGIHPSVPGDGATAVFDAAHLQFGFTVRNLTALQVLQRLMIVLN